MKMVKSILILLVVLVFAGHADAKWWIFGQNKEEVSTRYLYLNDISYDELGETVTLYRESLPHGKVAVKGQGSAGASRVGAVQVSLDNKQNWHKAKLTADGSFNFEFEPEQGRVYDLYVKIIDTTGKSNDIDTTHKKITITEGDIRTEVSAVLQALIEAYRTEDSFAFMRQVSDSFVGGLSVLDSAIRKDFNYFDNLDLYYTMNNVTLARQGKLFVSLSFSRSVSSSRTGETFMDKGETEFVLVKEKGTLKIYSMKNPLLFGLSDAANVATGSVNTGSNDPILVVDTSGTIDTKPYREALEIIDSGSSLTSVAQTETFISAAQTGTFTLETSGGGTVHQGFLFSSLSVVTPGASDLNLETNLIFLNNGTGGYDIGIASINSVNSVNSVGYTLTNFMADTNVGHIFALNLGSGKSAVVRISSYTDLGGGNGRVVMEYKYQPDGSTNF